MPLLSGKISTCVSCWSAICQILSMANFSDIKKCPSHFFQHRVTLLDIPLLVKSLPFLIYVVCMFLGFFCLVRHWMKTVANGSAIKKMIFFVTMQIDLVTLHWWMCLFSYVSSLEGGICSHYLQFNLCLYPSVFNVTLNSIHS